MTKAIGRNDPCPCGHGKKYKHCCLDPHGVKEGHRNKITAIAALVVTLVAIGVFFAFAYKAALATFVIGFLVVAICRIFTDPPEPHGEDPPPST